MGGDYRNLFLAESREHLDASLALTDRWVEDPGEEVLRELMRHAHSIKGMAAAMGFDSMVALSHAVEDLLQHRLRGGREEGAAEASLVGAALGCLERMIDRVASGHDHAEPDAAGLTERLRGMSGRTAPVSAVTPEPGRLDRPAERTRRFRLRLDLEPAPASEPPARAPITVLRHLPALGRVLHVRPPQLDARTGRSEDRLEVVLACSGSLEDLESRLAALPFVDRVTVQEQEAAHPAEPSLPEEPTAWLRVQADHVDDVVEQTLDLLVEQARSRALLVDGPREVHRSLERQQFLLRRLYASLIELRLVPFERVSHRLRRALDRVCREAGKPARLEIDNGQIRLDRRLLDRVVDALLHLVHNAVDHGLEPAAERNAAGKPATGRLRLTLERRGHRIEVGLEDDGRGLSPERLRAIAVRLGFLDADRAAELSDEEALMLITLPGFSTAEHLTHISGRGVGMDVVRASVEHLGGRIAIRSLPGQGSRITLDLPATLALISTLVVRCAGELFALPVADLRRIEDLERWSDRSTTAGRARSTEERLPLVRLDEHLDLGRPPGARPDTGTVLEIGLGSGEVGLVVDEIVGQREMIVRPMQPPLTGLPLYAGLGLLEEGSVVLVLDPASLAG